MLKLICRGDFMGSMKEVAKKAGVSTATVSAVINESKYVSDQLKARVNAAIQELNYRPNRNAQGLRAKKTNLIGVTVTELTNPFYPLMVKGVEDVAHEHGYNMMLAATADDQAKELNLVEAMVDQGVEGVVLSTVDDKVTRSIDFLEKEDIPYVLINRTFPGYTGNLICVDSYEVGKIATEYLISLGHRKIGFFGGDRNNSWERQRGYMDVITHYNLDTRKSWVKTGTNYDIESAYQETTNMILSREEMPTAIFAASDVIAFGVVRALLDSGYRIPEDISVIGSDNIPFTEDFRIPLTTVEVQTYHMGAEGFRRLHQLMRGKDKDKKQHYLTPSLVIRESTREIKL
jgi:LacI family transcriptional regulator